MLRLCEQIGKDIHSRLTANAKGQDRIGNKEIVIVSVESVDTVEKSRL